MKVRRAPRIAQALLHLCVGGRYGEDLEGDLLEEFAAGRSAFWFWRQVGYALHERACVVAQQQFAPFVAATGFFLVSLWAIAPATYPVMSWAHTLEPLRILVLLGWLAGVPFVLGGIAGVAERRRRSGAILLAAGLVWMTPVTLPFHSAVCDLCARPVSVATPGAIQWLTPLASALLAGFGAWVVGRAHRTASQ